MSPTSSGKFETVFLRKKCNFARGTQCLPPEAREIPPGEKCQKSTLNGETIRKKICDYTKTVTLYVRFYLTILINADMFKNRFLSF